MRTLRLLHKWLGLIVGLQLLLWTVSGFVFAWLDRGDVEASGSVAAGSAPVLPSEAALLEPAELFGKNEFGALPVAELAAVGDTWVYRLRFADRVELRRADDGAPLAIDEPLIRRLAAERYAGKGVLRAVIWHAGASPEVRATGATWEASFADADRTSLYFSAADAAFLAARNDAWRLYDFFWMLHTMDYRSRDDFNNPWVILLATGALWLGVSGALLLLQSFGLTRLLDSGPGSRPQDPKP